MESFYNGKNVLILGGAGFIGSNLAIALVRLGAHITIIDNLNKLYGGNLYNLSEISDSIEFIKDDIRNHGLLKDCLKKKQVIFDLVGQISYIDSLSMPYDDAMLNSVSHLVLLDLMKDI